MARKLDRNRSYGKITPPHKGAYFDQDGILFDHQGLALPGQKGADKPQPAPPPEPEPAAAPVASAGETPLPDASAMVSLKEPFFTVQGQIKALTGMKPKNKAEAREILETESIPFTE